MNKSGKSLKKHQKASLKAEKRKSEAPKKGLCFCFLGAFPFRRVLF